MEWIIAILATILIFGLCMAVFALKARREGPAAKLHACGNPGDCRCREKPVKILEDMSE